MKKHSDLQTDAGIPPSSRRHDAKARQTAPVKTSTAPDIAVIGMACRVPGADSYQQFWTNLLAGANSVSEIPEDRWEACVYYGDLAAKNKSQSKWGGFVADAARFDAAFFGISPREAERMDPQQRFMLELAWQCIEDSGYLPGELSGRDIGVYIGASTYDYKELQEKHCPEVEGHTSTGVYNCIIPNRVSYFFNFHGPSIIADTACSSSLVAIHQAVNALRGGECEAALAGGVSLLATPTSFISFGKVGMLSPTGACRTFDDAADGYVRGEGGGLILLKPLARALEDGDNILGVIKATAVNHGGRARSLTAPSAMAQSKVITAALRRAGVSSSTISYVEAHGTGTPLGDPIEVLGLSRAFTQIARQHGETLANHYCALGTVKSNIGHLEAGAGTASVIKVLLAMRYETLPANPLFTTLNSRIDLDASPFYMLRQQRAWKRLTAADGAVSPLRAGVSSFGFGGANSHIVIEERPPSIELPEPKREGATAWLLALSAQSDASLRQLTGRYAALLRDQPQWFADICREAGATRTQMGKRLSVVANSPQRAITALEAYAARGEVCEGVRIGTVGERPQIGFLFTGQGAQYAGMGKELYATQSTFRAALDQVDGLLVGSLGRSIIDVIFNAGPSTLSQTRYTQPALFAVEYALAQMWQSVGIHPDVVIGHSVGEIVAACIAGVFSLDDAVRLVVQRGQRMDSAPAAGAMAAVYLSMDEVARFLEKHALPVDIAADNAPQSTVISGEQALIEKAMELLAREGAETKRLEVSQAFHSRLMEPIQRAFHDDIRDIKLSPPKIKFISNVTGKLAGAEVTDPQYWVDHIRRPVLFRQGIGSMRQAGVSVFLEVGPAPVLTGLARRSITDDVHWLASLTPRAADDAAVLDVLAQLFALGPVIDFRQFGPAPRRRMRLPTYPFTGDRFWIAARAPVGQAPAVSRLLRGENHPLLGRRLSLVGGDTRYYTSQVSRDEIDYLNDHRVNGDVVLPGAAYLEIALAAARGLGGGVAIAIEEASFHRALVLKQEVLIQTLLKRTERQDRYLFEIWSAPASGMEGDVQTPWKLHASGVVIHRYSIEAPSGVMPGVEARRGRMVAPAELYTKMNGHGLEYGPGFQGVCAIEAHDDRGVAEVTLPAGVADTDAYQCHPALLDAIFQSALPLLPAEAFRNGLLPLPVAVEKFWLRDRLAKRVRVGVRLAGVDAAHHSYRCDYRIYAMDGELLGEVNGLTLKSASLSESESAQTASSPGLFYQPVWRRQPVAALKDKAPAADETTLLIYTPASRTLAEAIAQRLSTRSVRACIGVDSNAGADGYAPDASDPSGFAHVLAAHPQIDCVYFLGGYHAPAPDRADNSAGEIIDQTQNDGVLSLFQLIKQFNQSTHRERALRLKVVTNRSYAIVNGDPVVPWGAATHGLASVFCNENAAVSLVNIDLDIADGPMAESLFTALGVAAAQAVAEPAIGQGSTVAFRGQVRYRRYLEPIQLPRADAAVYRDGGVYFILGGAGGIGLAWSRRLAEKYRAKLVWVGRSALNETKRQAIADIERLGGEVMYIQADGNDVEAMKNAVRAATERFGRLNGAIHSALVLRDQSLLNMDLATFREGLDPKVRGAWALWQAVRNEPLDFLMFFSSVVAFLANRGQGNYSAGCVFKDAFAHYLRNQYSAPVKIINWGRWGGIGAVASEEYSERLTAQGVQAIEPGEGIDAIDAILASPASQIAALRADSAVLDKMAVDSGVDAAFLPQVVALNIASWPNDHAPALVLPAAAGRLLASYAELNQFAVEVLRRAFHDMAGDAAVAVGSVVDTLKSTLGIVAPYQRLYRACIDMLQEADVCRIENGQVSRWISTPPLSWPALINKKKTLIADCPWLRAEGDLLWECGHHLVRILRGEIPATQVLFPDLSMSLVEGVYSAGPLARYYNERVADAVLMAADAALARQPNAGKVRIVEIGSGSGGASRVVLDRLRASAIDGARIEYVYTDISPAFLQHGIQQFGKDHPFLSFATLDIEKPVEAQGYEAGGADIVFASNVLHATRDLARTLQNAKCLLKRGGALILHELVQRQAFLTLTFGLLEGWWLADDAAQRIAHSPLLTPTMWRRLLREQGFAVVIELAAAEPASQARYLGVIVAESDGRIRRAPQAPAQRATDSGSAAGSTPSRRAPRISSADVLALSKTAASGDLHSGLLSYLRGELADVLHLRDEQLDNTSRPLPQMLLSELGIDSLTAMDLRNRLRKQLAADVPVEKLLGGSKIQTVADLLQEQLLLNRLIDGKEESAGDGDTGQAGNDMETFVL